MKRFFKIVLAIISLLTPSAYAVDELPVTLEYSDLFEIVRGLSEDTIYITGSTRFAHGDGKLFADSAIWIKGEKIILKGNVLIRDTLYQLSADRVDYNISSRISLASGKEVTIVSMKDSIKAIGPNAYFSRDSSLFRMSGRPRLNLNYPDSSRLIEIDADFITYESSDNIGYADGSVEISQLDTKAYSDRAIMYSDRNIVLLLGSPKALHAESEISGDTLIILSDSKNMRQLYAQGNSTGHFKEPSREDSTQYDISDLKADIIEFNFEDGLLDNVRASGQAYSYYFPASLQEENFEKNHVSGDSIRLYLHSEALSSITVSGGAEGQYLMGEYKYGDSGRYLIEDTVFYASDSIFYIPDDSVISLVSNASVNDKKVFLSAAQINYQTSRQIVTAYDDSAKINDSAGNYIPVILKDGTEELIGSYLEYSMATEKGMIRRSRSEFQDAYYRGKELFRDEEDVFYVKNGIYTSCDQEAPHFHFWCDKMKIIKDDRAMARWVFLFIEKVPFPPLPLPYYIFPLKKGRHSGILPFRIGSFSRGGRVIKNVGYYWAPSDYWDLQTSFDYIEDYGLIYNASFKYNLRYYFSGSVSGSYINESHFVQVDQKYTEFRGKRWSLRFDHSQTFSPTFSLRAGGNFISDKSYYTDYSTNEDDRLNRSLKSQVSISKKFGSTALTAQFEHNDEIDLERRTDLLPSASLSFPSRTIFGTPPKDDSGNSNKKWYHGIYGGYSAQLRNYSQRQTKYIYADTDTSDYRSRKEYLTLNHNINISAPFSILSYLKINPSFHYTETWYEIFRTDQSDSMGIDASTAYRRYAYSAGVSSSTDLYGTIEPHLFGLQGLRHVLTPSVGFSWSPEINRHELIRTYTGAGSGGAKQRSMNFGLRQLFQAKIKSGENSKKIDLLTINSSFNYNFEATGRKLSNLSTSAQTSLLKKINLSASWVHDLYIPGTETIRWWSPYLLNFSLSTTFRTGGVLGQYALGDENSDELPGEPSGRSNINQGWNFSLTHHYSESGRGQAFRKTHTVNFSLDVSLTPNLNINYRQYYDFTRDKTISRSVTLVRKLHCWEGRFSWVIDGSNAGYQFRLNVVAIPEIKYEKSQSDIRDSFF